MAAIVLVAQPVRHKGMLGGPGGEDRRLAAMTARPRSWITLPGRRDHRFIRRGIHRGRLPRRWSQDASCGGGTASTRPIAGPAARMAQSAAGRRTCRVEPVVPSALSGPPADGVLAAIGDAACGGVRRATIGANAGPTGAVAGARVNRTLSAMEQFFAASRGGCRVRGDDDAPTAIRQSGPQRKDGLSESAWRTPRADDDRDCRQLPMLGGRFRRQSHPAAGVGMNGLHALHYILGVATTVD